MPRSRNIKPGFFANDDLAEFDPLTRLLFIGLWTVADPNGVLEDKPRKIKAQVLPYDTGDAAAMIEALVSAGFVDRFQVKGESYLHITGFKKHQNPHPREKVLYPTPDKQDASNGRATVQQLASPDDSGKMNDDSGLRNEEDRGAAKPSSSPADDWEFPEGWERTDVRRALDDFAAMRVRIKKPIKSKRSTSKLFKHFDSPEHLIFAAEHCEGNQYQGLKPDYRPPNRPRNSRAPGLSAGQQQLINGRDALEGV